MTGLASTPSAGPWFPPLPEPLSLPLPLPSLPSTELWPLSLTHFQTSEA